MFRYAGGLLAALVMAFAGGAMAEAATAPAGPRLAIVKNTLFPFRFDLETVDERGAQPLRLAGGGERKRPLPEEFTVPSWSSDGSKIVFVGLAGSIEDGLHGTQLYISSADGSEIRPMRGTHSADEPRFPPGDDTVVFARYGFRRQANQRGRAESRPTGASIWQVDVSGGPPKRVTPARNGLWMFPSSFSPDGNHLLASRFVGRKPWEIVKIDLATGQTDVLLRRAFAPVYSPDGSKIAFLRWRAVEAPDGSAGSTTDLFSVETGGGGLRSLTRSPGFEYSQSWDPSGERLAYVRYPPPWREPDALGFGSAVLQVNADGTCRRPILRGSPLTAIFAVAWQPGPGREAGRIEC